MGQSAEDARAWVDQLAVDYTKAEMPPEDRAMLDYIAKLTRAPWRVEKADVDALRQHGFEDRAIHDMCNIGAYFAYVNRTADGLGVELEDRFEQDV